LFAGVMYMREATVQVTGLFAMRGWNALVASGSTPEGAFRTRCPR